MLHTQKLIKAIEERTVTWQLADIKPTAQEAKKYAAQVYTQDGVLGVKVLEKRSESGYPVIFWQRSNQTNEC